MKRERNLLLLTAALSMVLGFVPGAGSGVMGALALPFVAAGWCLRTLSWSGGGSWGLTLRLKGDRKSVV